MPSRGHALRALPALLALSLTLAGCPLMRVPTPLSSTTSISAAAERHSVLSGVIKGPAEVVGDDGKAIPLIARNGSGLIARNGSGLIARNGSGLIARNGSGYRISANQPDVALENALVYFTSTDEQLLRGPDGEVLRTTTDENGHYTMPELPTGQTVVVTVLLPGNRRLVGYTNTVQGDNTVDVDLSTTYVTEFLRDHAKRAGKKLGDYPLNQVRALAASTRQVLANHTTDPADIRISELPTLRSQYAVIVGTLDQALSDAWKALLGYRPLAVTPVAHGLPDTFVGFGLAVDRATDSAHYGTLYVAGYEVSRAHVRAIAPDGTTHDLLDRPFTSADGFYYTGGLAVGPDGMLYGVESEHGDLLRFDPTSSTVTKQEGVTVAGAQIGPYDLTLDDQGTAYIADAYNNRIIKVTQPCTGAASVSVLAGSDFGFGGDDGQSPILFAFPSGIALHDGGLYVADGNNQRVRRLDLAQGRVETVFGNADATQRATGSQDALAGTFDQDGNAPTLSALNAPNKVAFDAAGHMFVADEDNQRVRVVLDGRVKTVLGLGANNSTGRVGAGEATEVAIGRPGYLAFDQDGNLLVSDGNSNRIWRLWLKFGM